MTSDLEVVLQQNLNLRRQLAAEVALAVEPVTFGHKILTMISDWWIERFGRSEDQPLFFALLLVLIAITIYVFA
jgi:hypothetical protein